FSFFDNLIGNGWIREAIENGDSVESMVSKWQDELQAFKDVRRDYLIYTITVDDITNKLEDLEEKAHIEDEAMRILNMHLTALAQYEAAGSANKVTKHTENGDSVESIVSEWQDELHAFKDVRRDYLIYTITVDDITNKLEALEENGHIEDEAMRILNMHLTALAQYEAAGSANKVTKHTE